MKKFKFKKIDAFTFGSSHGNPAAGVYLNSVSDISDKEMQIIAKELKGFVSEVVFLFPEKDGYFLKYYSSECEVEFCGHGTVAIMFDLIKNSPNLLNEKVIDFKVGNEILKIYNQIDENGSIFITAPNPAYPSCNINHNDLISCLNISSDTINNNLPIDIINAGLNTLIVPIMGLDKCLNMRPDQKVLKKYCLDNNIDIIHVFTSEVSKITNNYRTRVFAPKYGYLEDPATGSGNSAFGYYLLKNNLWNGQLLNIEQNSEYESPNLVKLSTIMQDNRLRVLFGGSATLRIEGTYTLN